MAAEHENRAEDAVKSRDYLAARVNYMKCLQSLKNAGEDYAHEVKRVEQDYLEFAKTDPILKLILRKAIPQIKASEGMLQSELVKSVANAASWADLYAYNRPLTRDDLYYALSFGEKLGFITREKKGRSFWISVNGDALGADFFAELDESKEEESVKEVPDKEDAESKEEAHAPTPTEQGCGCLILIGLVGLVIIFLRSCF